MESTGHAAALWVGLHLLLLLVLSTLVVRQRQKHKVALGDDGIPELVQAIRAHTNAVEYIPAALIGLVVLEVTGAPGPWSISPAWCCSLAACPTPWACPTAAAPRSCGPWGWS